MQRPRKRAVDRDPVVSSAGGSTEERARLMTEHSIGFDGRHYVAMGYRYDQLADAVAYAQRMRAYHESQARRVLNDRT